MQHSLTCTEKNDITYTPWITLVSHVESFYLHGFSPSIYKQSNGQYSVGRKYLSIPKSKDFPNEF